MTVQTALLWILPSLQLLCSAQRTPRLKFHLKDVPAVRFDSLQRFTAHFHDERSASLYIGMTGRVVHLSFGHGNVSQTLVHTPCQAPLGTRAQRRPPSAERVVLALGGGAASRLGWVMEGYGGTEGGEGVRGE
ncbi:hypothetical protein chiPu_0022891 [Chiloscyllium punctatum]|uniref:Sema domain-containing protein n=1 Tax=Chiloscyllium punctatum TaxID=137246 RepID=A0A401T838_CHIPU|nr:hypothetical protein [Chiloscyllium punctatum]